MTCNDTTVSLTIFDKKNISEELDLLKEIRIKPLDNVKETIYNALGIDFLQVKSFSYL